MAELGYFLNIDKPAGITSRDVVNRVSRLLGTRRVGHAGTLDPLATGVLVVAVERATRLVEYVQAQSKTYEAEFLLGQSSDTDDVEGNITEHAVARPPMLADISETLGSFVGPIMQRPPKFSALKINGTPAYKRARQGEEVELVPRPVVIHSIDVLEYHFPALTLRIHCGSGTYIRSIARDLGELLGTGGLMSKLRRTAVGVFQTSEAIELADATRETFLSRRRPLADGVALLEKMTADAEIARRFARGQFWEPIVSPRGSGEIALIDEAGEFLGIAEFDPSGPRMKPLKGGFSSTSDSHNTGTKESQT